MDDKGASATDEWQEFRDLIASKSTIQVLEIIENSPLATELNELAREAAIAEQELSACLAHYSNIYATASWIEEILSIQGINGAFYFYFNASEFLEKQPSWIKANLGDDYHWVYPLWEVNDRVRSFAFIPLDRSYYLEFTFSEGYYRAYLSYQRHILIRIEERHAELAQLGHYIGKPFDPRDYD